MPSRDTFHAIVISALSADGWVITHDPLVLSYGAKKGHYELSHIGWDGVRRVHGSVIHIDIIGDKIWIQHDGTSPGVAQDLLDAGVPRESIVLGFHPEYVRKLTGFAVT